MKLKHIPEGRKWGYPICCIVRFALSNEKYQAKKRGVCFTESGRYVPCNIFHKAEMSYKELKEYDYNSPTD